MEHGVCAITAIGKFHVDAQPPSRTGVALTVKRFAVNLAEELATAGRGTRIIEGGQRGVTAQFSEGLPQRSSWSHANERSVVFADGFNPQLSIICQDQHYSMGLNRAGSPDRFVIASAQVWECHEYSSA
jgi:hypothetical protein